VAFNSTEIRPVNKKIKAPFPGPGTYIDIKNPFHCSIKGAQQEDKMLEGEDQGIKPNPFGSNIERECTWLRPKEGPDPGYYNAPLVKVEKLKKDKYDLALEGKSTASTRAHTAAENFRCKVNSVFTSTTDRFNQLEL